MCTHRPPIIDCSQLPLPDGLNLEDNLQRLQDNGLLAPRNQMLISELLNPEDETPNFQNTMTPKDFFEQFNAPPEDTVKMDAEAKALPTASEALKAVSLIMSYIEGSDHHAIFLT